MDVQVIEIAADGGVVPGYCVIPEERSDEIHHISDLRGFDGIIRKFISILDYTDWIKENPDMNVTSFWKISK